MIFKIKIRLKILQYDLFGEKFECQKLTKFLIFLLFPRKSIDEQYFSNYYILQMQLFLFSF